MIILIDPLKRFNQEKFEVESFLAFHSKFRMYYYLNLYCAYLIIQLQSQHETPKHTLPNSQSSMTLQYRVQGLLCTCISHAKSLQKLQSKGTHVSIFPIVSGEAFLEQMMSFCWVFGLGLARQKFSFTGTVKQSKSNDHKTRLTRAEI